MLATGVVLLVLGVLVLVGSWVYAAVNVGKQVLKTGRNMSDLFDNDESDADPFQGLGGTLKRHLGAVIGMVLGGGAALIGLVLLVVALVTG